MPDGFQPSVRLQVSDNDFDIAIKILEQLREEEE
jgi:hypothetical protein